MKRRTLLSLACGSVTIGLAGCLGDDDTPADGADTDDDDTTENGTNDDDETDAGGDDETDTDDDANGDDGDEEPYGTGSDGEPVFEDSFSAVSQGGFIAINEPADNRADARSEGFALPAYDDGDEAITIDADVGEDGTWESTAIEFPPLDTGDEFDIDASVEVPDGLSGVLFENRMTITGRLRIVIEGLFIDGSEEFSFEIDATTERSGMLEGEANFETAPPTGTVVDNEFVIDDETENFFIDDELGLPADEPGANWFEVDVELH